MDIYHGSSVIVTDPIAKAGRRNLDFGKGFYTTRIKDQAKKWAILVASRKSDSQRGIVNIYQLDNPDEISQRFTYKVFLNYDMEWLEFVVACRQGKDTSDYDIVEGGVANDQVIDTVEDYENHRITAEQALDQLKYKKPNNQICIRNQEIIDRYLHFITQEEVNQN